MEEFSTKRGLERLDGRRWAANFYDCTILNHFNFHLKASVLECADYEIEKNVTKGIAIRSQTVFKENQNLLKYYH